MSHTALETNWTGVEVWNSVDAASIEELKQRDGGDIVVYGSASVVRKLADLGVVDEYLLFVAPIILGDGIALFDGIEARMALRLAESRAIGSSGNVLLRYLP